MGKENKENEVIVINTAETPEVVDETKIKLSRVYQFEGQTIGELDVSGLETLTANDMIMANKVLNTSGNFSVLPETSLEYTLLIAAKATKLPIEFFKALTPRDAVKVKNKVTNFFFGAEDAKELRKLCIVLSMNLRTGLDYFLNLSFFDLLDLCAEIKEVNDLQHE